MYLITRSYFLFVMFIYIYIKIYYCNNQRIKNLRPNISYSEKRCFKKLFKKDILIYNKRRLKYVFQTFKRHFQASLKRF